MLRRLRDFVLRMLVGRKNKTEPTTIKIRIRDTILFQGTLEEFDIQTEPDGSEAIVHIKFRAADLIRKIAVREL